MTDDAPQSTAEEGQKKQPRAYLGDTALALMESHGGDPEAGYTKRLDSAITALLERLDAASNVASKGNDQGPSLLNIEQQIDERADLANERISDGFTSIARQLTALKSEIDNTHTTINVLRSFLVMVVAALRDEDLTEQTEMVMAEIDGLIKPMKAKSYDPARTRQKRREQRELAERQMSPTANEPVLASGNQFEQTNDGERER